MTWTTFLAIAGVVLAALGIWITIDVVRAIGEIRRRDRIRDRRARYR